MGEKLYLKNFVAACGSALPPSTPFVSNNRGRRCHAAQAGFKAAVLAGNMQTALMLHTHFGSEFWLASRKLCAQVAAGGELVTFIWLQGLNLGRADEQCFKAACAAGRLDVVQSMAPQTNRTILLGFMAACVAKRQDVVNWIAAQPAARPISSDLFMAAIWSQWHSAQRALVEIFGVPPVPNAYFCMAVRCNQWRIADMLAPHCTDASEAYEHLVCAWRWPSLSLLAWLISKRLSISGRSVNRVLDTFDQWKYARNYVDRLDGYRMFAPIITQDQISLERLQCFLWARRCTWIMSCLRRKFITRMKLVLPQEPAQVPGGSSLLRCIVV